MRQTVGGAQSEATRCSASCASVRFASNRAAAGARTEAPAFHGAKKELQACLAQPG
jgi:hypothetical protein